MSVSPYISCADNGREAVEYYARVFHVPVNDMLTYGEMPGSEDPIPEGAKDLVAHTFLVIHGTDIGFSDHFPPEAAVAGNNVGLLVTMTDQDTLTAEFDALSKEGQVEMPVQETFWAKCYGAVRDKYGVSWQFMIENDPEGNDTL
jgi:PhnB protein